MGKKTTDTLAWLLIGALAAVTAVSARAQEPSSGQASVQGSIASGQDAGSQPPAVAGVVRPSGFLPVVQVVESYDDNVFLSNTNRHGDVVTDIIGLLTFAQAGPRWQLQMRYMPEFNLYRTNSSLNYVSQGYGQEIDYRVSSKTDLRWMFGARRYPARGLVPGAALSLDGASFVPLTQGIDQGQIITEGDTSVEVTRRMSEHSRLRVDLNGGLRSFSTDRSVALPNAASSQHNSSLGGDVSWETEVSRTRTIGFVAAYSYFLFPQTNTHNSYQAIDVRVTQKLPHQLLLSIAAGPGWLEEPGTRGAVSLPSYDMLASVSGNAGQLSSWTVSYSKSVQASLLPNSLASQVVSAQYQHKWSRRWWTTGMFGYTRSLSAIGAGTLDGFAGTAQVAYQLGRGSRVFASYGRAQQTAGAQPTAATPLAQFSNLERTRVSLGFVYEFSARATK
jgi:hypothetical protein